jgi:hypothetical protein
METMVESKYDESITFEFLLPFHWSIKYKQGFKGRAQN